MEKIKVRFNETAYNETLEKLLFFVERMKPAPGLMKDADLEYKPATIADLFLNGETATRKEYNDMIKAQMAGLPRFMRNKLTDNMNYDSTELHKWKAQTATELNQERINVAKLLPYIDTVRIMLATTASEQLREDCTLYIQSPKAIARYNAQQKALQAINEYLELWPDTLNFGKIAAFNAFKYSDTKKQAVIMPTVYDDMEAI